MFLILRYYKRTLNWIILNICHESHVCDVNECLVVHLNIKASKKAYSSPHWSGLEIGLLCLSGLKPGAWPACSPQLEHDQGFYQGLKLHVVKRFWLGNHLARFPSLEITCYVCQFAGTREMTLDSPRMLAGPGALPACSPVLGLREGSHGQEISYISEYWVNR